MTIVVLFEGSVCVGLLLALADIVNWWGVVTVPVAVAAMVKFNDIVAGAVISQPTPPEARTTKDAQPVLARGVATVPVPDPTYHGT